MKLVLLIPPFDFARSVRNTRPGARDGILPSLGVGCLAAYLAPRGVQCSLVDAMAEQLDAEQAAAAVAGRLPDVVGISALNSANADEIYAAAAAIKRRLPRVPLIMGGPHVTAFAREIPAQCPEVDIMIPGDAETVLAETLDRLAAGAPLAEARGLFYRDASGNVVETPPALPITNLDALPPPARSLYRHELYRPLPTLAKRLPATTVMTSRGCPWAKCQFCFQGGPYAIPYRRRSPEHVLEEIECLVKDWGMRNIIFWDDNFCAMPGWVSRFCELMRHRRPGVVWSALARANSVSADMLRDMAAAGCHSIQYGIETGNQELLDLVKKGITLAHCENAVRWAKAAGLSTVATFILGLPRETPAMTDESIRFACRLNPDYVSFFIYTPVRGTPLAEIAMREGRYFGFQGDVITPSYVPEAYPDAELLARKVVSAYRRFYLRPAYWAQAAGRIVHNPSLIPAHATALRYWMGLALPRK